MTANKQKASQQRIYNFDEGGSRIVNLSNSLFAYKDNPSLLEYYMCLGGMLHLFSTIEQSLGWLLSIVVGQDQRTINAIMHQSKSDNSSQIIRRVITAKRMRSKRVKELIETLDQLSRITKTRNDLLHKGARIEDGNIHFVISNDMTMYHKSKESYVQLSNNDLVAMEYDLMLMMALWFDYKKYRIGFSRLSPHEKSLSRLASDIRSRHPLGSPIPWLYKSPSPKGAAHTRPRKLESIHPRLDHLRSDFDFGFSVMRRPVGGSN